MNIHKNARLTSNGRATVRRMPRRWVARPEERPKPWRQRTNRLQMVAAFPRGGGSEDWSIVVTSEILPPCPPVAVQVQVIAAA